MIKKFILKHWLGGVALGVIVLFFLTGVYAPLLASSKPIAIVYEGTLSFPLFDYLFYSGFYTKPIDLFFNLLMFTLPFFILFRKNKWLLTLLTILQCILCFYFIYKSPVDPASNIPLSLERQKALQNAPKSWSWDDDLRYMNREARINLITRHIRLKNQHQRLLNINNKPLPTLWQSDLNQETLAADASFLQNRRQWLDSESNKITFILWPLLRDFHWEDDAGGDAAFNRTIPWYEITRSNRRDFVAALLFGIRISFATGLISIGLALLIGIPVGAVAGYFGGKTDMVVCRLLEVWESMPTFFMLLMSVAILQSKSIFLVIGMIGIFGWTGFSRFIRGEFLKQKNLSYVEACHAVGYPTRWIMFKEIMPNAISPIITLLPFAIMGAITSEAGLSFLGLGEEGSTSWGVLMDEGRRAFPAESYLLWPPAILLTILLVAIALVGDAIRDELDPKLKQS
jgi:peptide/nickel transport system permease protein